MKIAVVGLGLIGGSFCKAITSRTDHSCWGIDNNSNTIRQALSEKAIDCAITPEQLSQADLTIIALHPQQTIDFITEYAGCFRPGSTVMDTCGVKAEIVSHADSILSGNQVSFVGCHPMAGREFSGFSYALETLFDGASFIITPSKATSECSIHMIQTLSSQLGFQQAVITTPHEHDQIIAFTSQLAHVVSNAYIKSPTLQKQRGFSAGSFLDLTRVAKLNEEMWTSLFMMNKQPLLFELDTIINKLSAYKQAMEQDNSAELKALLKEGRILKENSLKPY